MENLAASREVLGTHAVKGELPYGNVIVTGLIAVGGG